LYGPDEVEYVCPDHGSDGTLDVRYDYGRIAAHLAAAGWGEARSMWRYLPLLPVDAEAARSLIAGNVLSSVGCTPLYAARGLAELLGLRHLWIKVYREAPDRVVVEARDDGVGADMVNVGNGLRGMRERLQQCGGQLQIETRPGEGFRLRATVPATVLVAALTKVPEGVR